MLPLHRFLPLLQLPTFCHMQPQLQLLLLRYFHPNDPLSHLRHIQILWLLHQSPRSQRHGLSQDRFPHPLRVEGLFLFAWFFFLFFQSKEICLVQHHNKDNSRVGPEWIPHMKYNRGIVFLLFSGWNYNEDICLLHLLVLRHKQGNSRKYLFQPLLLLILLELLQLLKPRSKWDKLVQSCLQ